MKMKKTSLLLLLPLFTLSLPSLGQETPEPPALVDLEPVRSELISKQIWVPGTVISRSDSNIASEVSGRITWMAEVGQRVEQGQVLAKLDDQIFKLEFAQNQSNIAKWTAKVEQLQRRKKRFASMLKLNNSSMDQQEEIISELAFARQELVQANIASTLTKYRLSQTQVKAPFSALVVNRLQSIGEYTSTGMDIMRIVDTSNVEASIKAPLSAVPYIKKGMQVAVKSNQTQKLETIRAIVPVGNAQSRMMEVRVALMSGDFAIGSAVRIALPHSDFHQATTVPRDALVLRKSGSFIYTVDGQGVAQQVMVQTGIGVGERIEVIGDLDDRAQVVVRGAERLRPGQKVRYTKTNEIAKLN
jgi:RND family efflux transporter MFP subunit